MLRHSSLDDIDYSPQLRARKPIKQSRRHRRHRHQHKRRKSIKFVDYGASTCAVCLDDSCALDTTLFPCGHSFHGECLIQWVRVQNGRKFNCPLCRRDIAHFVPNSSNQAINDQLVEIWNEQNLYKPTTADNEDALAHPQHSDCCDSETHCCSNTSSLDTSTLKTLQLDTVASPTESTKTHNKASIWKFLWNSPSSIVACRKQLAVSRGSDASVLTTAAAVPTVYTYQSQPDHKLEVSRRDAFRASQPFVVSTRPTMPRVHEETINDTRTSNTSHRQRHEQAVAVSPSTDTSVNLRAGLFAGIAAGTTTYVATANKLFVASALRGSLLPVLSETVPSVAVFFASYEALKSNVFGVDTNKSTARTFSERFASASMASTLGFVAPTVAKTGGFATVQGLLPLRFAFFFGTFEMCKDAMDAQHQRLGAVQVASAAAMGGTLSHALCYPILERQALTATTAATTSATEIFGRSAYRGWASSLSKFLPSCVACSCAFEYGKRYLTTRRD